MGIKQKKNESHEKDEHLSSLQQQLFETKKEIECQQDFVSKLSKEMKRTQSNLTNLKTKIKSEQTQKKQVESEKKKILQNQKKYKLRITETIKKLKKKIGDKTKEFEGK